MTGYRLMENLYVLPTPAGAYYAVCGLEQDLSRNLLRLLLQQQASPLLTLDALRQWTDTSEDEALELLYRVQGLGWLEGFESPHAAPAAALEEVLPDMLLPLSGSGKALLADSQGFYLASQGFPHETAEELSALSADLASLHERHRGLLKNNLNLQSSAWALVDAAGNSQVGCWPLYIGEQRFVLVIGGLPHLNQPTLTELIWTLSKRYAVPS